MKITNTTPISRDMRVKKAVINAANSDFASFMDSEVGDVKGALPASPISALAMLNEVEDALEAPRKTIERGNELLDELEKIRDGLLFGGISVGRLQRVAQMLAKKEVIIQDPQLAEIMEEIEIRAAVELAKLGRF